MSSRGWSTKHPKFGLDTAALWQYANEPYHMVSNFSICWLTFSEVWGYFSRSYGCASLSWLVLNDPDILILHITNYFCCSSSWLMLNNWKLTYILFSAILLVMVAYLGFTGEALVMSLLSCDFLEWLDVCIFEWGRLKAILIQFWALSSRIRSVVMWFYLWQVLVGLCWRPLWSGKSCKSKSYHKIWNSRWLW